jgi:hypothetical protein
VTRPSELRAGLAVQVRAGSVVDRGGFISWDVEGRTWPYPGGRVVARHDDRLWLVALTRPIWFGAARVDRMYCAAAGLLPDDDDAPI